MNVNNEFNIGDTVFLSTDQDQLERLVTALTIYHGNGILYELSCGSSTSRHYEFEISKYKKY